MWNLTFQMGEIPVNKIISPLLSQRTNDFPSDYWPLMETIGSSLTGLRAKGDMSSALYAGLPGVSQSMPVTVSHFHHQNPFRMMCGYFLKQISPPLTDHGHLGCFRIVALVTGNATIWDGMGEAGGQYGREISPSQNSKCCRIPLTQGP